MITYPSSSNFCKKKVSLHPSFSCPLLLKIYFLFDSNRKMKYKREIPQWSSNI